MDITIEIQGKQVTIPLTKEQVADINKQTLTDPYILACQKMREVPRPPLTDLSNSRLLSEDFAHRLEMCIEAKNAIEQPDGSFKRWVPNYDGNESHWFPYHKKSGSGWAYGRCDDWHTITFVGPRREYRTKELMLEGVEEFAQYYDGLYNN